MQFRSGCLTVACLALFLLGAAAQTKSTDVPHVIRYSGTLQNVDGTPRTGTVGVTFSIYADQTGSAPLWQEIQNVVADDAGHYAVLLGAARGEGLPDELFAGNAARWISVRVESEREQARALLAAVPYALKAGDAETLGGKPLSAFVLATPEGGSVGAGESGSGTPGTGGSAVSTTRLQPNSISASTGTAGQLAVWTDSVTLGTADFSDVGGFFGIGTATPQSALHVFSAASPVVRIERSSGTANTVMNFVWNGVNKADFGVPGANDNFVNGSLAGDFALRNFGGNMLFSTDSGAHAQLYLKNGGNVGIGTTSPAQPLDVAGNINTSGNVTATGTVTAATFSGSGASLTSVPAGTLTGTVPSGAISGTYSSAVTFSNAANSFTGSGANLTSLPAGTLTGTVPSTALSGTYSNAVTLSNASNSLSGSGANLTSLPAGNLTGTVPSAALSGTYSNALTLSNASNTLSGSGANLTNVNAANLGGVTAAVLKTRVITYLGGCDSCAVLTSSDNQNMIYKNLYGATLTFVSITCYSDAGTPSINIQRDNGSTANVTASAVGCSTTGNTVTNTGLNFNVTTLAANEKLNFLMTTPGTSTHRVTVIIVATL